jgi:transposase
VSTSGEIHVSVGIAPILASSGKTHRHRLNRGGDRHASAALYRVAMVRLRDDTRTQAHRDRLAADQKADKDIIRCPERAIAREIYQAINTDFEISNEPS